MYFWQWARYSEWLHQAHEKCWIEMNTCWKVLCFGHLYLTELCTRTDSYYFWECWVSQTATLMPVVINFSETFTINRIIKIKVNETTGQVCLYKIIKKKDSKQDICAKNQISHRVLCHVLKHFTLLKKIFFFF